MIYRSCKCIIRDSEIFWT